MISVEFTLTIQEEGLFCVKGRKGHPGRQELNMRKGLV